MTDKKEEGISLFGGMVKAQKLPMSDPNKASLVEKTAREYSMDRTIATLWVTKAKYQDAFIQGNLAHVSTEKDGTIKQETLADKKIFNPQNPEKPDKVPANDILGFLYEENVGEIIVRGKNQTPQRRIPKIQHATDIRDDVELLRTKGVKRSNCLISLINALIRGDVNRIDINFMVNFMVKSIRKRQNAQQYIQN